MQGLKRYGMFQFQDYPNLAEMSSFRLIHGFLILALVLRGIIPIGYMPDFHKSGAPQLTICGGKKIHTEDGKAGQSHDAACPFNVHSLFSFAGVATPGFILVSLVALVLALAVTPAPNSARRYGNASPRSPPSLI